MNRQFWPHLIIAGRRMPWSESSPNTPILRNFFLSTFFRIIQEIMHQTRSNHLGGGEEIPKPNLEFFDDVVAKIMHQTRSSHSGQKCQEEEERARQSFLRLRLVFSEHQSFFPSCLFGRSQDKHS
jgi:hypothetical protein